MIEIAKHFFFLPRSVAYCVLIEKCRHHCCVFFARTKRYSLVRIISDYCFSDLFTALESMWDEEVFSNFTEKPTRQTTENNCWRREFDKTFIHCTRLVTKTQKWIEYLKYLNNLSPSISIILFFSLILFSLENFFLHYETETRWYPMCLLFGLIWFLKELIGGEKEEEDWVSERILILIENLLNWMELRSRTIEIRENLIKKSSVFRVVEIWSIDSFFGNKFVHI